MPMIRKSWGAFFLTAAFAIAPWARAESIWIEAEDLRPLKGSYFPAALGGKTDGAWGISGPGVAAEWTQGGESGFMSIAAHASDAKASASIEIDVPVSGKYHVWVRYGDRREKTEPFSLALAQQGTAPWSATFGLKPIAEEDNEMKLYFGWAFAWDHADATLAKGKATLTLAALPNAQGPRQIDCIVLTTDDHYLPQMKERPASAAWDILNSYRSGIPDLEPLVRKPSKEMPDAWKLPLIKGKHSFVYFWNMDSILAGKTWLTDDAAKVRVPYNVADADARAAFEKEYAGKTDVPIFGDPRIVPTFHGVGPSIFKTDPKSGEVDPAGALLAKWLDANPDRFFAGMMNYHPGNVIGPAGMALVTKYKDRYLGSIAGESLGYFTIPADVMIKAVEGAVTHRQYAQAIHGPTQSANFAKYEAVARGLYADPTDAFRDVISCESVGNMTAATMLPEWGAKTIGYESTAATFTVVNMRRAFMRGIARQRDLLTATYRSCNFGDSATMFSKQGLYTGPQYIYDNYYSPYSGAGMTWYKFDIWYQYMAGANIFYHEQGFDEFWLPGGGSFGLHPLELSPKGKLVDRFLRVTKKDFDRGTPYTPIAVLVDYAHGWEPSPYWPNQFQNMHQNPDALPRNEHDAMMSGVFSTLYHPIGPESEKAITGVNETFLPGVFGDVFDVIAAYPDVAKWKTIDSYPALIVAGDIELTLGEGKRLAQYVNAGGTLLVTDANLTGPGAAELKLPAAKETGEAAAYAWMLGNKGAKDAAANAESPAFRYGIIDATGGRVIASDPQGKPFCVSFDRGEGRLIYLAIPRGMTVSRQMHPAFARLVAHLTRGLMPIQIDGDVTKLVNKNSAGWMITLLNPAGQDKPQHGMTPTDFKAARKVTIRAQVPVKSATDKLNPDETIAVKDQSLTVTVPAGGLRIIELK